MAVVDGTTETNLQTGVLKLQQVDSYGNDITTHDPIYMISPVGHDNDDTPDHGESRGYQPFFSDGSGALTSIKITFMDYKIGGINGSLATPAAGAVTSLICFTKDCEFSTSKGMLKASELKIGDLVMTYEHGFQPIRYIYKSTIPAQGKGAPVIFEKGALGNNERLVVSQLHRIHTSSLKHVLKKDYNDEALIHAVALTNGTTIRIASSNELVTYYHIMFDHHELLWSAGILSESWQPHRRNLRRDKAMREELLRFFPEIGRYTEADWKNTRPMVSLDECLAIASQLRS